MTTHILPALVVAAAIMSLGPAAGAATDSGRCGSVDFVRQSDDGAFRIVAHDTSCGVARAVASGSRPERFRTGRPSYSSQGFRCAGRDQQLGGAGKEVVRFRCTRGASAVRFLRG